MSATKFIDEVRGGVRFLVADFVPSSNPMQIRVACLTMDDIAGIPQFLRTTALAATRAYLQITEGGVADGESVSVEFGGEETVSAGEMISHVRKFLAWASLNWPTESRFVKSAIRDGETARMCLDHDLRPGGFITDAELFMPNIGGSVVSLQPDAAPLGRTPIVATSPDGSTRLVSGPMPVPEGATISIGEFKMPDNEG